MLYFNKYSINEILSKYNIYILKYIKKKAIFFLFHQYLFIYNYIFIYYLYNSQNCY